MNQSSDCETMIPSFVLDAILVKATFQTALLEDIVAEHPELWSGMQFRITDHPIFYEFTVISIAKVCL